MNARMMWTTLPLRTGGWMGSARVCVCDIWIWWMASRLPTIRSQVDGPVRSVARRWKWNGVQSEIFGNLNKLWMNLVEKWARSMGLSKKLKNLRIKSHFTNTFRWFYQIEPNFINILLALVLLSSHITHCRVVIVTLRRIFDENVCRARHEMATIHTQAHSHKRTLLNSACVKEHTNHHSLNRCRKMSKYNANEHTWCRARGA